jgi:bifunctional non-homologous end joining protein LigD
MFSVNLTVTAARDRPLSRPDGPATPPSPGLYRALHPVPRSQAAVGPDWVHEVKHDGYRLIVRRAGETVRLFTRRGYDWTDRYPAIASAAAKLKARSFTLDDEAVVAGADGGAVFDALHRRGRVTDAILQAFDLLELDGEDLRPLPLGQRKPRLARLLTRAQAGIALNEHTDAKGELIFRQACVMGLEGIVSKRLTAPYRSGPSRDWAQGQEPGQPGNGETSGGAMVAPPELGDTAAWACGRGAWTLPKTPSGRLPMLPRARRRRPSSNAGMSSFSPAGTCCGRLRSGPR